MLEMTLEILNSLKTPVIIVDQESKVLYENKAVSKFISNGLKLEGLVSKDENDCIGFICNTYISNNHESRIEKEVFDYETGIYWNIYIDKIKLTGEEVYLIQFLDINMQKLKERSLFTNYTFKPEIIEHINDIFEDTLDIEFSRSSRTGVHYSLILYSVDNLNDMIKTNGEKFGNKVIRKTGQIWTENIRNYDYAPYYLDKNLYSVILPAVEKDTAKEITSKIYAKIKENLDISISFGIGCSRDTPSSNNLATLVKRALYVARQRGGDTIAIG